MSAVQATPAVLYVDDEPLIQELTATALEDAGFEVVIAASGEAALDALDGNADPFCAIVTDINLGPGPDGWAVARRARELSRGMPVVYVSGASAHEWRAKGVPHSIMITKPFTPTEIAIVIARLLGKTKAALRGL